ncbi:hypothetical protein BH160DRAFT_0839 [Burkholderia sp. H160]|nr:hypothetical protein BH160DRAFT_0839 [Burkholderia sp. H160]
MRTALFGEAPHPFDTIDLISRLEDYDGVVSLTLRFVHPMTSEPVARHALAATMFRLCNGTMHMHSPGTCAYPRKTLINLMSQSFGSIRFRRIEADCVADGGDFALANVDDPNDAASGEIVSEAFHLLEPGVHAHDDLGMTVEVEPNGGGWQLAIETNYRAAACARPLLPIVPVASQLELAARASTAPFKADETCAAPTGEVRAINALSAIFYG